MAKFEIPKFIPEECEKYGKCPYNEGCKYEIAPGRYKNEEGKYVECHFKKEYNKRIALMLYQIENGLNSKKDYTFVNYVGQSSINSLKRLMDISLDPDSILGTNLYIFGPNGTQKTTMVKAMCRRIAEQYILQKKVVKFSSMSILVNTLANEQEANYHHDDYEIIEATLQADKLRNADILVLDESFDVDKMKVYKSKWNLDLLDSFIRTRMDDADKSTIYISNIQPEFIDTDLFGHSIRDLIDRDTEVLKFLDRYDTTIPVRRTQ